MSSPPGAAGHVPGRSPLHDYYSTQEPAKQDAYAPLVSALLIPLACMAAILCTIFKLCNVGAGAALIAVGGAANLVVFFSLMH